MQDKLEQRSFLLLLIAVTVLFLYLLKPFFGALFWACALTILFYPLQKTLNQRWPKWPNAAALTTLLVCMIVGIIPTLFLFMSFLREGIGIYQSLQNREIDIVAYIDQIRQAFPALDSITTRLNIDQEKINEQVTTAAVTVTRFIAENAVQFGQGTLRLVISLCLMLYVTFFLLRDGHTIMDLLVRALPIGDERERMLMQKFAEVTRATVKGNLVVAIVQGSLGGFIFWVVDIPSAVLWGAIMTILAMIPMVGVGIIWVPVAIYLFATGAWGDALILTLFGAGVIGVVDNILRPILVGRDTKMPDYIVLLSTLGGIVMFGINGFVIGPLIAALFFAFWQIFMREFNPTVVVASDAPPVQQSEDSQPPNENDIRDQQ